MQIFLNILLVIFRRKLQTTDVREIYFPKLFVTKKKMKLDVWKNNFIATWFYHGFLDISWRQKSWYTRIFLPIMSRRWVETQSIFFILIWRVQWNFMFPVKINLWKSEHRHYGHDLIPCHFSELLLQCLVSFCPLSVREYSRCIIEK